MDLIRLLHQKKLFILLLFFIYILFWLTINIYKQLNDINKISVS